MKKIKLMIGLGVASVALWAQLEPLSVLTIWQNGVPAGVIYSPDRAPDATTYAEHWLLFPNYANPSAANGLVNEIIPTRDLSFANEAEFFRAAPWGAGYRYVQTLSYDTTVLPGR